MNVLLFIIMITISFIVVRMGAIAFQLTGLEWSLAKFQSLSCFTGTGFTTKEAELVTGNPQRRRIASVLMVLGNAGLVTMIATFANSLRPRAVAKITIPFLDLVFPAKMLPLANLAAILIFILFISKLFTYSKFTSGITRFLKKRLIKREILKPVTFEELLVATGGYGVSNVEIREGSPILDKTILETGLRKQDINILAIEREGRTIPNPPANTKIEINDSIVCFGKLENIRKEMSPRKN